MIAHTQANINSKFTRDELLKSWQDHYFHVVITLETDKDRWIDASLIVQHCNSLGIMEEPQWRVISII